MRSACYALTPSRRRVESAFSPNAVKMLTRYLTVWGSVYLKGFTSARISLQSTNLFIFIRQKALIV